VVASNTNLSTFNSGAKVVKNMKLKRGERFLAKKYFEVLSGLKAESLKSIA